jgi:ferredoxin
VPRLARADAVPVAETEVVAVSTKIVVNPIMCVAHGICADLLPEWIELDDWGYPIVDGRPLPPHLLRHARRAAAACPTLALLLREEPDGR